MFCSPCLLYNGENSWTKVGVKYFVHLNEKIRKHEPSKQHFKNFMDLALLGKAILQHNWTKHTGNQLWNTIKSSEKIGVLWKIINSIKFYVNFESSLDPARWGSRFSKSRYFSSSTRIFRQVDATLKDHFMNATVFKSNLKTIQNELLNFMLQVCREKIITEIKEARTLAIMSDDTTNVSKYTQQVIVFRYLVENAVKERIFQSRISWCNQGAGSFSKFSNSYFFSNLTGIPTFFSHLPFWRIPRGSNTKWKFNSRVVNTVYENVDVLK